MPPLGSYYNFINRLWLCNPALDREDRKRKIQFNKKPLKTKAPGKNKKLPNRRPGITKITADFFRSGRSFDNRVERLLQEIFALIAVKPSSELGLISKDNRVYSALQLRKRSSKLRIQDTGRNLL